MGLKLDRRYLALDGLRGIAALVVVLFHCKGWPSHLTGNRFVTNSYLAVDLFFLLSGIVISETYSLKISNLRELYQFVWLRFFRIYPMHFVVLIFFVGIELLKLTMAGVIHSDLPPFANKTSYQALVANIFLVNGLHTLDTLSWNEPSWSISCEFAVYLIFGTLAMTSVLYSSIFIIALAIGSIAIYLLPAIRFGNLDITYNFGICRCIAGFLLGVTLPTLGRFIVRMFSSNARRLAQVIISLFIIVAMSLLSGPTVVCVVFMFALLLATLLEDEGPIAAKLKNTSIQTLGQLSYSVYMIQYPVLIVISFAIRRCYHGGAINSPWIADIFVIAFVLSVVALSRATYLGIESPGRNFGRRYIRRGHNNR
jgi:peptidoglycan/LPS O-acetylase OafA/YrhL